MIRGALVALHLLTNKACTPYNRCKLRIRTYRRLKRNNGCGTMYGKPILIADSKQHSVYQGTHSSLF